MTLGLARPMIVVRGTKDQMPMPAYAMLFIPSFLGLLLVVMVAPSWHACIGLLGFNFWIGPLVVIGSKLKNHSRFWLLHYTNFIFVVGIIF